MQTFENNPNIDLEPTEYTMWGGGTGTSAVAEDVIDELGEDNVTFLIGTADSGSRNGRLRELVTSRSGRPMPALTDLRRVISAVSGKGNTTSEVLEVRLGDDAAVDDIENYGEDILKRASFGTDFEEAVAMNALTYSTEIAERIVETDGNLKGHTVGNIVMAGLFMHYNGDLNAAVQDTSSWVDARARVMPISNDPYHLVMNYKDETYFGEGVIDDLELDEPQLATLSLEAVVPETGINLLESARKAIIHGKNVILPGSYWTTHGGTLLIPGTTEALQENKQPFNAVANLEAGRDIRGFSLADYRRGLGFMAGRDIDLVIRNHPETLPEGKVPLRYEEGSDLGGARIITTALLKANVQEASDPNDPIAHLRSDMRTDGRQVGRVLTSALAA